MAGAKRVRIKRVYEPPAAGDGYRVLVDRLWPRGLTKQAARVDLWLKDIAPSTELRRWYGHDPEKEKEFRRRYARELRENPEPLRKLRSIVRERPTTLVYASRDEVRNHAVMLRELLARGGATSRPPS